MASARDLNDLTRHADELMIEDHKTELYKQVGRVMVAISNVENFMAIIFVSVTQGMSQTEAAELFYRGPRTIPAFGDRLAKSAA
jgi:hypothetical protein